MTAIKEFILLGFGNRPELQPFFFSLFLMIYILTLTGNFLIILLVVADQHLHTPMYLFPANLSCLETCYSSTIPPKMLANVVSQKRTISVSECLAQFYFFGICVAAETYILAVMSYDRYLAICRPLQYASIMNGKLCFQFMTGAWINSLLVNCIAVRLLAQLYFCGPNIIDRYFCDLISMEKLSYSDTSLIELVIFILPFFYTITAFLLTLAPYVYITTTILKIPSAAGRKKAFLTCSSPLIVVCIYYRSLTIVYMLPDIPTLRDLNKVFPLFYILLPPLMNPLIYSLRNKQVHKVLGSICSRWIFFESIFMEGTTFSHMEWKSINLTKKLAQVCVASDQHGYPPESILCKDSSEFIPFLYA